MQSQKRAGISRVPLTWLKSVCGNDANGMSIVVRLLCKIGWLNCDKQTSLYSLNINTESLSLYDLCLEMNECSTFFPEALNRDDTGKQLQSIFQNIKLSQFIRKDVVD